METAPQITLHGVDAEPWITEDISDRIDELERSFGHITSCRVTVELPHRKGQQGHLYHVAIVMELPGGHVVSVGRDPGDVNAHEDLRVALRDSFEAARRQMQTRVGKMEGRHVKSHPPKVTGTVMRLWPDEGYGFAEMPSGDEVYFHRDSVERNDWAKLDLGATLHFTLMEGDKGFFATHITVNGTAPETAG